MEKSTSKSAIKAVTASDRMEPVLASHSRGNYPAQPPTPAAAGPDTIVMTSEQFAGQLRDASEAVFLYGSMTGLFNKEDTLAYKIFRDRLLADAGNPSDPIEVMMIEQIVLAHMNTGRLQVKSAMVDDADAAKTYGGMAAQLLGEFRRTCLALQGYRLSARQLALTAGDTKAIPAAAVAGPEPKAPTPTAENDHSDGRLISQEASEHADGTTVPFPTEEPAAGRGGEAEQKEAQRAVARGA